MSNYSISVSKCFNYCQIIPFQSQNALTICQIIPFQSQNALRFVQLIEPIAHDLSKCEPCCQILCQSTFLICQSVKLFVKDFIDLSKI